MEGKKIGLVLALDGEKEFVQAVQNAHKETKLFESQLKGLSVQCEGSANTLESLQKKNDILTKTQDAYRRELEAAQTGLENANKVYREQSEKLDELQKSLEEAKKAQKEMADAGEEGTEAYEKQVKSVKELEDAVEKQTLNRQKASGRITDWNKRVYESETALNKSSKAIEQNEKYIKEAQNAADKCATSIDNMGKEVKDAGNDFGEANKDISTFSEVLKANLTGSAIIGGLKAVGEKAVEAGKYVVDVGSSFEAGMSQVSAISGATGSDLEALTEKAKEMGSKTKFSASEAAEAMNYMAMAGWKTSDMLGGIEGIMNLAAASGEDLATTSDIVTDALTGFGLTAADSGHFADILAQASSNANTNVSMMGETFKYVAPVAGALGYSAEDVSVAIGLMANSGIKASSAGTALRTLLTNLAKPTATMATAMDDLGISLTDTSGEMKPLDELMQDLRYSFSDLTEEQKAEYAATLAGKEGMSGLLAIVNASSEDYQKLSASIANCDGAAEKMANTMQDNLSGKLTIMGSALEGLGIAAYNYVSGPLSSVVEGVTSVIVGITDAITPQKSVLEEFIDDVGKSNKKVRELLDNADETVSNAENDVADLEAYKKVLLEINSTEDKTEFQKYQLKKAVETLSGTIPGLAEAFDEERGVLNLTNQELIDMFDNAEAIAMQNALIKAQSDANDALAEAVLNKARADSAAEKALSDLEIKQNEFYEAQQSGLKSTSDLESEIAGLNSALGKAEEAQKIATQQFEEAKAQKESDAEALRKLNEEYGLIPETLNEVSDTYDAEAAAAESAAARQIAAQEEWNSYLQQATAQFVEESQKQVSFFSKAANLEGEELQKATQETIDNMQSQAKAMENWADNIQKLSKMGLEDGLMKYLAEMGPQGAEYVAQFASMTDDQIRQANEAWKTTMEQAEIGATFAGNLTGEIDKIASELKESAKGIGTSVTEGASEGMEEGTEDVIDSSKKMSEAIPETSSETLEINSPSKVMQRVGSGVTEGLANGIIENILKVVDSSRRVANSSILATQTLMKRATFYELGKNVPEGMTEGILSGRSKVVGAVESMCKSAIREAQKTLDINSPSKVFEELGDYSAQGYGIGFESKMADIRSAINASMRFEPSAQTGYSGNMFERNLTDTIENALYNGMIYAMSKRNKESGEVIKVELNIDGQRVAEKMVEINNEYINRNGNSMF